MLDFSVTFGITIINVVILFFILRAILFKPVTKFMEDRAQRIRADIEKAGEDRHTAKQMLEQYEARLAQAESQAEAIIADARKYAEKEAEHITAEGKAEAERITAAARARIETERLAAFAVFKAEAAALVVQAAGQLLKRELAGADHLRYAAEILDRMAREAGN